MEIKTIYEDQNILVVDKPAGISVYNEEIGSNKALIDLLIEKNPELKKAGEAPRYGIIHRLDKDTSGLLLVAKTPEALIFSQKQFKTRRVEKKYLALAVGKLTDDSGTIETLIGRSPKDRLKQKTYSPTEPGALGKRKAITEYKILQRFEKYTLVEAIPKTGRKHQIRCHLASLSHPIAGDKLYGFKNQLCPKGLERQFLHAANLKFETLDGKTIEVKSELPEDLKKIITELI